MNFIAGYYNILSPAVVTGLLREPKMRILCGTFLFGVWVFELELVNVANVKISNSNVANFQLGIGIDFGNISTMATFTSVGVGEWKSTID